jgi:hypothetical protein
MRLAAIEVFLIEGPSNETERRYSTVRIVCSKPNEFIR